eukprot:scaffold133690_cov32-Tisochrysis_lutea.AAC.3
MLSPHLLDRALPRAGGSTSAVDHDASRRTCHSRHSWDARRGRDRVSLESRCVYVRRLGP